MEKTTGARIEEIAQRKGLPSGKRLAALFGVSYETLRKWREGLAAPNRSRQEIVARALDVMPEEFMFGAEGHGVPDAFDRRLSLAAIELAQQFDAVADPATRRRLYWQIEGLIRQAVADAAQPPPAPVEPPTKQHRARRKTPLGRSHSEP